LIRIEDHQGEIEKLDGGLAEFWNEMQSVSVSVGDLSDDFQSLQMSYNDLTSPGPRIETRIILGIRSRQMGKKF
jgi:hypothetical protein